MKVLEVSKQGYSIKYEELDEIILKLKESAALRDMQAFKTRLSESFIVLHEKTIKEIEDLQ